MSDLSQEAKRQKLPTSFDVAKIRNIFQPGKPSTTNFGKNLRPKLYQETSGCDDLTNTAVQVN
jgi:hypothetical protein